MNVTQTGLGQKGNLTQIPRWPPIHWYNSRSTLLNFSDLTETCAFYVTNVINVSLQKLMSSMYLTLQKQQAAGYCKQEMMTTTADVKAELIQWRFTVMSFMAKLRADYAPWYPDVVTPLVYATTQVGSVSFFRYLKVESGCNKVI